MNREPTREPAGRPLSTSDLAAAGSRPAAREQEAREQQEGTQQPVRPASDQRSTERPAPDHSIERSASDQSIQADQSSAQAGQTGADAESERLDPLFAYDLAEDFRSRWAAVHISFVDDPRRAVRQGDELVAQCMKSLAETFADERARLEGQLSQTGEASTETLRVALRRYRSFFERLLSL
jgi:hypothetical protein